MPDQVDASPNETSTAQAPAAANSLLPSWQDVRQQWMSTFPELAEDRVRVAYEGIAHAANWQARVQNSQETTGSWLYRRALPVGSAQLNVRNAGYVDTARQRIAAGTGTSEDAEVMAVQNRLAESDANAGTGERILGGIASIPAIAGEAYLGSRVLSPVLGLFGRGAGATAGASSGGVAGLLSGPGAQGAGSALRPIATRFAQGAATAPLMPSLYAQQAIENNREAGRAGTDWRGFPSAITLAAVQNGVFSSVGSLTGSAPTGPGALDTARRVFAQGVNAMAVQQGMDIATSAVDDVSHEVFGQSLNLSTRYGIIGRLWRGEQGEALQDAVTQAVTMFAFSALHEAGSRPTGQRPFDLRGREMPPREPGPQTPGGGSLQEPIQWLGRPGEATGGGPLTRRSPVAEGMNATRGFLNEMSGQGRSAPEAAAELHRVMTTVENIVTTARDQGISREQARQKIIDTFPEGQTRDYGLRVVDLVPLAERPAQQPQTLPERSGARETAFAEPSPGMQPDLGPRGALATAEKTATGQKMTKPVEIPGHADYPEMPNHVAQAFAGVFPGARVTSRLDMPTMASSVAGGTEVIFNPGANSVHVDIGVNKHGVGASLDRETLGMMRGLQQFIGELRQHGTTVEYRAIDYKKQSGKEASRARVYAKLMERSGYEKVSENKGEFVWKPKESAGYPNAPEAMGARPPLRERMMERGKAAAATTFGGQGQSPAPLRAMPAIQPATWQALEHTLKGSSLSEVMQETSLTPLERHVMEKLHGPYRDQAPTHEQIGIDPETIRLGKASGHKGEYGRAGIQAIEARALKKLAPAAENISAAVLRGMSVIPSHSESAVDAVIHGEMALEKAEKKLQNFRDFIAKKESDLRMEVAADAQAALEAGVSQSEIDKIIKASSTSGKNVTKSSIAKARGQLQEARRNNRPAVAPGPATILPPGSRQNPVETGQGQTTTRPAAAVDAISHVQSAAVPGGGQASSAIQMSGLQKAQLSRMKNPAQREFAMQNMARKNRQAKTLYDAITARGGLNEAGVRSYGLDLAKYKEDFPPGLFTKKGGISVEELVGGSEIGRQIWGDRPETENDKQHRGDDLMSKLANHYLLEHGNWFEGEQYAQHLQDTTESVHEQLRGNGFARQAIESATNAKTAALLDGVDRIADEATSQPQEVGDAFEDEWAPKTDPRELAQFLHDFHGDESGHLDLAVLQDFALQYGVKPARNMIAHLDTVWRQLAGEGSPRTTDVSRTTGEALERFNGSEIYARFVAPILAEKVLGENQSPEFQELLGGTLTERRFRWMRKVYNDLALAASADLQKAIVERDAADAARKQSESDAAMHRRNGMPKAAATADAYAKTFAKASAEANTQAQEASARSAEAIKARNGVPTLIGLPDSPFATFTDYRKAVQSKAIDEAIKRHEQFVVPVMEDAFRRSKGMNPADPINSPTQIPGSPVNLKSAKAGDKDVESVIWTKGGPGQSGTGGQTSPPKAGRPPNAKLHRNKYTKQATGSAEGYDINYAKMVEASLVHQLPNAAKAEAIRAGVEAGVYQWGKPGESVAFAGDEARWGQEFNDVKPPQGTQAALAGQTSLYVHPDMAHEFRRAIEIDEPLKFKTIEKFMGAIMAVNLASTAELTYHAKNQLGFLMRTGFNPISLFRDIVGVINSDPKIMDELVELARINTMKTEGFETDNWYQNGRYNPLKALKWGAKLLDLTRKVLLLQGNKAYGRMVKAGLTKETETGRRNFLNQLGNYNRRSQHKLVKLLRDTQIGPFATAGFNYLIQGVRSVVMNPGVKPATMEARLRLRAGMLLRTVAVLAAVELLNKVIWGRLDASDDTPLGAIRTGTSQGGTSQYADVMDWIGLKRGLRVLGLLSLIEGKRKNALPEKIIDRSARDIVTAVVHPLAGPGAQFALTAAYGVDASGFHVAEHAQQLRHDSQALLNLKAAAEHANPAVGTLFSHSQARKPLGERVMGLAGPFGIRTAPPPRLR